MPGDATEAADIALRQLCHGGAAQYNGLFSHLLTQFGDSRFLIIDAGDWLCGFLPGLPLGLLALDAAFVAVQPERSDEKEGQLVADEQFRVGEKYLLPAKHTGYHVRKEEGDTDNDNDIAEKGVRILHPLN